jgi:hypothetical protein
VSCTLTSAFSSHYGTVSHKSKASRFQPMVTADTHGYLSPQTIAPSKRRLEMGHSTWNALMSQGQTMMLTIIPPKKSRPILSLPHVNSPFRGSAVPIDLNTAAQNSHLLRPNESRANPNPPDQPPSPVKGAGSILKAIDLTPSAHSTPIVR